MGRCGGSSLQGGTHFSSFAMVAPLLEEPYTTVVDASPWAEGGGRGWGWDGCGYVQRNQSWVTVTATKQKRVMNTRAHGVRGAHARYIAQEHDET
jgi:hypothetical protein